jgi:hypothetical protein
VATCPPSTENQLIDLLNADHSLPASVYKIRQVLYTANKGPVLEQAVFPTSYTPEQIDTEYTNFVSTRLIQAVKETEFVALYRYVTGDQLKFNYFYKKLTYDIVAMYDLLLKFHAADLRKMIDSLNSYVDPINTQVLVENVFNPVNKIWGFSAIATLYCMYIRVTEGA